RLEHGESEVANRHFLARVEDELEGELGPRKTFTHPRNGAKVGFYELTRDQCTLVGMRESKAVRRTVLAKLKAMDSALPVIKDPQLAAVATMLTQLDAVKQEQASQRNEIADIRAKVETSPRDYYTVAGYASLRGLSLDVKRASLLGRKASKLSREYGVDTGEAHSEVFGTVKTYHVDVLAEVFNEEAA
ncbi:hypothetical protein, partial [Alkalilimnicola ehrlichii]